MKLFNGVNQYTYQTIFGKIQLVRNSDGIMYKLIDEVNIPHARIIAQAKLFYMRFDNRVTALKKLKKLEMEVLSDLKTLLEKEI